MDKVQAVLEFAKKSGVDLGSPDVQRLYAKDTIAGSRPGSGWLYDNGPFTLAADDPISAVVNEGSPLVAWIPNRLVDFRFPNVAHIESVSPTGFLETDTYAAYLNALTIAACGYGPSTIWTSFEYQVDDGKFSFTSPVMTNEDFGLRDYEKSPIYQIRGSAIGQPLGSDAEWGVARALIVAQQHLNYMVINGQKANSAMEWDGLNTIIATGYVNSKKVSAGTPYWANPFILNAAGINDPVQILKMIRGVVRKMRQRLMSRRWSLQSGDMAIVMPSALWPYIADAHASGGNVGIVNTSGFAAQIDYGRFLEERARIATGGLGFGFIDVDGTPVPVLPDDGMNVNTTIGTGDGAVPGVSGDIYILTRRANGLTLLEQQFVDWSKLNYPGKQEAQEKTFVLNGGYFRAGWMEVNSKCFQYYVEARGRIVSYAQPFQARINNVAVASLLDSEAESGNFWQANYYAKQALP